MIGIFGQIRKLFLELFDWGLLGHFKLFLFETLLNFTFKNFVMSPDLIHKIFENLMSSASLLLWIHHVKQILIIFVLSNELPPFRFVAKLSIKKFLFQQIPIIDAIVSFPQSFLFHDLFFMLILGFHDVFRKEAQSVVRMKTFVRVIVSEFGTEVIPFHVVFYVLVLHQES